MWKKQSAWSILKSDQDITAFITIWKIFWYLKMIDKTAKLSNVHDIIWWLKSMHFLQNWTFLFGFSDCHEFKLIVCIDSGSSWGLQFVSKYFILQNLNSNIYMSLLVRVPYFKDIQKKIAFLSTKNCYKIVCKYK